MAWCLVKHGYFNVPISRNVYATTRICYESLSLWSVFRKWRRTYDHCNPNVSH